MTANRRASKRNAFAAGGACPAGRDAESGFEPPLCWRSGGGGARHPSEIRAASETAIDAARRRDPTRH